MSNQPSSSTSLKGTHIRTRTATLSPEIVYPCGNVWKKFDADESNQLSISKGDIIVVTERSGNYWWWGTNESTQVSGYFPKDHLWFHTPWRRAHDPTHGRDYFVNVITGRSVWEVPEGFVENDEVTQADLIVDQEAEQKVKAAADKSAAAAVNNARKSFVSQETEEHLVSMQEKTNTSSETKTKKPTISSKNEHMSSITEDLNIEEDNEERNTFIVLETDEKDAAFVDINSLKQELKTLRQENQMLRASNQSLEKELEISKAAAKTGRTAVKRLSLSLKGAATTAHFIGRTRSRRKTRGTFINNTTTNSFHSVATKAKTFRRSQSAAPAEHDPTRVSFRGSLGSIKSDNSSSHRVSNVGNKRGRRKEVTAEVIGKKEMFKAATKLKAIHSAVSFIKHSANIRVFISDAIANNVLFLNLEHDVLLKVVQGFEKEEYAANTDIITQGDKGGEYFYVVDHGMCHVLIEEKMTLKFNKESGDIIGHDPSTGQVQAPESGEVLHGAITRGGTFGELALMYNTPRQATIRAVDTTVVWKISRHTFHLIIRQHERNKTNKFIAILQNVPMLSKLTKYQLTSIAQVVGTETFSQEQTVFLSGENNAMLYIIESGSIELRLMKRGKTGSFHSVQEENNQDTFIDTEDYFQTGRQMEMQKPGLRPSMFSKEEVKSGQQHKTLLANSYFGINAVLSAASNIEYYNNHSAYATSKTQLLTLTSDDLIRIAGKEWIQRYASGIADCGSGGKDSKRGSNSTKERNKTKSNSIAEESSLPKIEEDGDEGNNTDTIKMQLSPVHQKNTITARNSTSSVNSISSTNSVSSTNSNNTTSSISSTSSTSSGRHSRSRSRTVSEVATIELPSDWRDSSIQKLEDLEIMQIIGKGSFGEVLLAKLDNTDRLVAVKKLKKQDLASSGCTPHVMNERKALAISHGCPFIINLFNTFADKRYLYFVLELCRGGDLFGLLCKCERIVEKDARFYAATVLNAFSYMHDKNIIYRDLKPENLLITESGYLKVADLGLAKAIPDGITYTMCGTPVYMAPEMLLSSGHGKPADAWAIGIMIYELCGGYPPFEGEDQMSTYELIINATPTWPTLDASTKIENGTEEDEEDRDNSNVFNDCDIVQQFKFGSSMKQLITSLLIKEPARRAGGEYGNKSTKPFADVMKSRWFSGFDWTAFYKQKMAPPVLPHVSDWLENFEEYEEEEVPLEYIGHDFDEFES